MKRNSSLRSPQKTPPNFGRVFSEEDEIELLKAFEKSIRKNPDLTFSCFRFGQFTQGQLCSKLKRLKAKYHLMAKSKSKIKTPQHRKIYHLSRKIWGPQNGETSNKDIIEEEKEEENFLEKYGSGSKNGQNASARVDLEKYPFLVEAIPEELNLQLYSEGLRRLGKEKCKELNDKWMILSIQNAEIQTEKSLLLQKQFIQVVEATRNRVM